MSAYYFYSCLRFVYLGYSPKQWQKRLVFLVLAPLCACLLLGQPTSRAQTQSQPGKRIALLIGNATYKGDMNFSTLDWTKLQNAAKDAQDVGNELKRLGFRQDDVEVLQNTGLREMRLALARFGKRAEKAAQVVFYFSGHGAQHRSLNYLIPVDAPARDRDLVTLGVDAIRLEEVLEAVSVGAGQKVVLIDACRTLPGAKGDAGGLANPESQRKLPAKTIVVFAAAAGQSALDGRGQANGYFAQGLLAGLRQNDTSLRNVIEVAEAKVEELSSGTQEVTVYGGSRAQTSFAFAPNRPVQLAVDPRLAESQAKIAELEKRLQTLPVPPAPQTALSTPQVSVPTPLVSTYNLDYYMVKTGDTLAKIAIEVGLANAQEITKLNRFFNGNQLEVGQLLRVKPAIFPTAKVLNKIINNVRLPIMGWPARGLPREGRPGIEILGEANSEVFAAAEGRVVYAGDGLKGYGNLIILKHGNDVLTTYAQNATLLV